MKRLFGLWILILIVSSYSYGQSFTTVTGTTITDGNGQVWSNMTVVANLIPPNGSSLGRLQNQGHAITDTPQYVLANSAGTFSISLDDNSKVTPSGSFWRLSLCSNTSSTCSTLDIQVSGVSMDITTQVQNAISSPSPNSTTTITRGYNVNEVTGGNGSLFWRTTDNTLWGCQTTPNASCPPGWIQVGTVTLLPTATTAGQLLYSTGPGNTYTANVTGIVDVRFGFGGSGGVDCTDTTDSTTIFQAMINNAPDYTQFFIPGNCTFKLSSAVAGTPAITIQQRVGLQFVAAGRNGNGCRSSQIGSNFAGIDYTSTYSAGNQVFFINHSQDLLFQNLTVRTSNGGTDQVFDLDQVGVMSPITTRTDFEYVCIVNQGARNPNFNGWSISPVSINNVENIHIYHGDVLCSGSTPTNGTSNGFAVYEGASANPKNIIIDDLRAANCSVDVYNQSGSDFTFNYGLDSSTFINFQYSGFNNLMMGFRSENATHSIVNTTGGPGPMTAIHNDFAAAVGTIVDGTANGCGVLNYIGNDQDSTSTTTINCGTGGSSVVALGNRNFNMDPRAATQSLVIGNANSSGALTITDTNFITYPFRFAPSYLAGTVLTIGNAPGAMFDTLKNSTYDHFVIQPVAQLNDPNVGLNINYLGTSNGYIGLGAPITGLVAKPNSTTAQSLPSISPRGAFGATSYSYIVQAFTVNGHSDCSTVSTTPSGNAILDTNNYNVILWDGYAGAMFYKIYRSASSGTPATTGLIGTQIGYSNIGQNTGNAFTFTFKDTGLAGDGTTCQAGNTTGDITGGRHLAQVATGNFGGTCAMAAGTSCTITLTAAYASTPGCVVTVQGGTAIAGACSVSGTTVTVTAASANSATWAALLFGNPN